MKKLLAAALAAAAFLPITAKAELDAYQAVVLTNAVYLCGVTEGVMQAREASEGAYDYLLREHDLERYQVQNLVASRGFWDHVSTLQRELGGCRKVVREIKNTRPY